MKALDAFAGAGGWDVAARRAGIAVETLAAAMIAALTR